MKNLSTCQNQDYYHEVMQSNTRSRVLAIHQADRAERVRRWNYILSRSIWKTGIIAGAQAATKSADGKAWVKFPRDNAGKIDYQGIKIAGDSVPIFGGGNNPLGLGEYSRRDLESYCIQFLETRLGIEITLEDNGYNMQYRVNIPRKECDRGNRRKIERNNAIQEEFIQSLELSPDGMIKDLAED